MQGERKTVEIAGAAGLGDRSAGADMTRGSIWMVAMRWVMRGIGTISTLVLVRLLAPSDFGVIAMAMIVVGFLEVLSQSGIDLALIRQQDSSRDDYNSAWTLQLLLSIIVALVLLASAPLAAATFEEPKLIPVIQALSIRSVFGGLQNVGIIEYRKNLNFYLDFKFNVISKSINFIVVVGCAVLLRNYWALVLGMISSQLMVLLLSYVMHSYRPRFCTRKITSLFSFSGWLVAARITRYWGSKVDEFVVGSSAGAPFMGSYHVANEISTAPTSEIAVPMGRGLYPVYAGLLGAHQVLFEHFLMVLSTVALLCIPIGFGLAAVARDAALVILGKQWQHAAFLIEYLAIFGVFYAIVRTIDVLFEVLGRVRLLAVMGLTNLVAMTVIFLVVAHNFGVESIAVARCAVGAGAVIVIIFVVTRTTSITLSAVASVLWHRFAAGLVMVAMVQILHQPALQPTIIRLTVDIGVGIFAYTAAILIFWFLRGRPQGAERAILSWLYSRSKFADRNKG